MQEFMFVYKAVSIFGFCCHYASTFYSFSRKKQIVQIEIHSCNELMIVRAEQFPEIKEFLVGFQCTTGSLLSAR